MKMYFDPTEKDCQHLQCKPLMSNIPCYTRGWVRCLKISESFLSCMPKYRDKIDGSYTLLPCDVNKKFRVTQPTRFYHNCVVALM